MNATVSGPGDLWWRYAYGAAVILLIVYLLNLGAYALCLYLFRLHPDSYWLEFSTGVFENNQSEVPQIILAAFVFKRFVWKGSPESKEVEG